MEKENHEHSYMHAHGLAHSHGHVHENQKAVVNRLARAIGHLEKVKRMVEEGYDCSEVLIQLAAVRSALDNTGKVILKDHIHHWWTQLPPVTTAPSTICAKRSISL